MIQCTRLWLFTRVKNLNFRVSLRPAKLRILLPMAIALGYDHHRAPQVT